MHQIGVWSTVEKKFDDATRRHRGAKLKRGRQTFESRAQCRKLHENTKYNRYEIRWQQKPGLKFVGRVTDKYINE